MLDGRVYLQGKTAAELNRPSRIVAIAKTYDNLCDPRDFSTAITPKASKATQKTLTLEDALKPAEYPERNYEYLGIKRRISYFYSKGDG